MSSSQSSLTDEGQYTLTITVANVPSSNDLVVTWETTIPNTLNFTISAKIGSAIKSRVTVTGDVRNVALNIPDPAVAYTVTVLAIDHCHREFTKSVETHPNSQNLYTGGNTQLPFSVVATDEGWMFAVIAILLCAFLVVKCTIDKSIAVF